MALILLNFEDCFLNKSEVEKNQNYFNGNIGKEFPVCSQSAMTHFKAYCGLFPNLRFRFTNGYSVEQSDKSWWTELFGRHDINVNVDDNPVIFWSSLIQDKMKEIRDCLFKEETMFVVDSFMNTIKTLAIKESQAINQYESRYEGYLGEKRRESLIPINQYKQYEHKENDLNIVSSKTVLIGKNETLNSTVIEKMKIRTKGYLS